MTDDLYSRLFFDGPAVPAKKRRKKTPKKDLEGAVLRECMLWLLDRPEVRYVERRNTGAVEFEDGGRVSFGKKGAADIFCLVETVIGAEGWNDGEKVLEHVEIECKRRDGKGTLLPDQKKFQAEMERIGVCYIIVKSAKELSDAFSELGLTD